MHLCVLNDDEFLKFANKRTTQLTTDIPESKLNRSETTNPQTVFFTYKNEIIDAAQKREKIIMGRANSLLNALHKSPRSVSAFPMP